MHAASPSSRWLARLRHDLVKRVQWPARDRRDLGGVPAAGELVAELIDDEGAPAGARELWARLAAEAPDAGTEAVRRALAAFEAALERALAAAAAGDVDGVLGLEAAFLALARSLEGPKKESQT